MSSGPQRRLLSTTLQSVTALGVMGIGLGYVLSQVTPPRSAAIESRGSATMRDPETTGSIGKAARMTSLDPCVLRQAGRSSGDQNAGTAAR